ncbi:hypothetical protein HMI54_003534 [Coelomomyces lativittatus]|nr:hypothetical protein HMI56_001159 [Coelomomyces lativittatus]KAJ1508099.1 hypothetical protein HMI54_003534 [Coelomomyces lativittatus]KAJ1512533.1 hypothetical protein HMI55_006197 [Coelomomyces lativittatus]
MEFSLKILLISIFFLQCALSFTKSVRVSDLEDIFTEAFSINTVQFKYTAECDQNHELTLIEPYFVPEFWLKNDVMVLEQMEKFLGTVVLTKKNSESIEHVGMSGYSEGEFPFDPYVVLTSTSFNGIATLGDLHERSIRFYFEIQRNALPSLFWCASLKINVPAENRDDKLPTRSHLDKRISIQTDPSLIAYAITSYNNDFFINKGTNVGTKLTRDTLDKAILLPIETATCVNIKSLVDSFKTPLTPAQQPPTKPRLPTSQGCFIPKCVVVRVECKAVKCVSPKLTCQEEVHSSTKKVYNKEKAKTLSTKEEVEKKEVEKKEVEKKEEEKVGSKDVKGGKKLTSSATTHSFSLVTIVFLSGLVFW